MTVRVEKAAYADVDEISDFYEEREAGIGAYFVKQFIAALEDLQATGGIHSKRRNFHFCPVPRFPVAVYYRLDQGEVRVCAVLDCRRRPQWIREQLKRR